MEKIQNPRDVTKILADFLNQMALIKKTGSSGEILETVKYQVTLSDSASCCFRFLMKACDTGKEIIILQDALEYGLVNLADTVLDALKEKMQ